MFVDSWWGIKVMVWNSWVKTNKQNQQKTTHTHTKENGEVWLQCLCLYSWVTVWPQLVVLSVDNFFWEARLFSSILIRKSSGQWTAWCQVCTVPLMWGPGVSWGLLDPVCRASPVGTGTAPQPLQAPGGPRQWWRRDDTPTSSVGVVE